MEQYKKVIIKDSVTSANIKTMFKWHTEYPKVLLEFASNDKHSQSFKSFKESILSGINHVLLVNQVPKLVVHAEIKDSSTVEGHVFACKNTSSSEIASAILIAKENIFNLGYSSVVCYVLNRHKKLASILKQTGFLDSGLRAMTGVYKNRILESTIFVAQKV